MKVLLIILMLVAISQLDAQIFTISYGKPASLTTQLLSDGYEIPIIGKPEEMNIVSSAPAKTFVIFKTGDDGDEVTKEFTGSNPSKVDLSSVGYDNNNKATFQIREQGENGKVLLTFHFVVISNKVKKDGDEIDEEDKNIVQISFEEYWSSLGFDIEPTQYGLIVKSGSTLYYGQQYVHIFLDQYGNSIYGTIPQGIADRQYVVHVIYQTGIEKDLTIFGINKTKGSFNHALNYMNSDILSNNKSDAKSDKTIKIQYAWTHNEFLLGTSTSDIEFDLAKITIPNVAKPYDYKNVKINSYVINMTPTYHGSFNVGFVDSRLENPTYQLVENPLNSAEKVVKRTNTGNRGVTTLMATVYTSPIVLLKKLFNTEIPWNKTYGRNFLDDHKFYERFYPVLGVGFTDKSLENVFYGINWEITRGAGIFFGWHYGKINIYNTSGEFEFEKSPTSQSEFDLNSNHQWRTSSLSVGVNVDPFLILRFFNGSLK